MSFSFKDHFSGHATDYAAARPGYPEALFAYLAGLCPEQELAWDCATGNGQAALGLANHFVRVIASDASAEQIAAAKPQPNIEYRVATAEAMQLPAQSCDLVTVAQALHWFQTDDFFAVCERVLKPAGVLAVWCYGLCRVSAEVDALVNQLYAETLDAYWPPERKMVEEHYVSMNFPFPRLAELPDFVLSLNWSSEQFTAYLRSWSATQRYIAEQGKDPLSELAGEIAKAWGGALEKAVQWPLTLIVCRK